ncbi:hypothetical protein [Thaumasiovibrio subtropicus]|uniref:hypothetical protein n=1 Tax=Thaumasiovibrio subtropicus TaxID=1891207 RepID=UPI000B360EDD|nr:hypothetical protein [Thaumasiovibrio subtropicus]
MSDFSWSWDGVGETLGGLFDTVVDGGSNLVNAWVDNQANLLQSASPEQHRAPTPIPQTPQGTPLPQSGNNMMPVYVMGAVIIAGLGYLAMKGR